METTTHLSRREIAAFLYRYHKRLLMALLCPIILAIIICFVVTPTYTASSVLIVRMGPEYMYQPEATLSAVSSQQPVPLSQQQIFKSEVAILDSADLHRDVVKKIGITKLYPSLAAPSLYQSVLTAFVITPNDAQEKWADAAEIFDRHFDIQLQKDSAVIELAFRHPDADMATGTLQTLLDLYMLKRQNLYANPRYKQAKLASDRAYTRMAESEDAIEAFKRENNLYSLPDEQASLLKYRSDLEIRKAGVDSDSLNENLASVNEKLDRLRGLQHQLATLENAAKVARDEYAIFLNRLDQARTLDDLENEKQSSVRVIQQPVANSQAHNPRPLILILGFVVGVISTLLTAFVTDLRRSTFSSPEDVERVLGLKVIASLPVLGRN